MFPFTIYLDFLQRMSFEGPRHEKVVVGLTRDHVPALDHVFTFSYPPLFATDATQAG